MFRDVEKLKFILENIDNIDTVITRHKSIVKKTCYFDGTTTDRGDTEQAKRRL